MTGLPGLPSEPETALVRWTDDGLDLGLAAPVPWLSLLALGNGRNGLEATYRAADGRPRRVVIGHVAPAAAVAVAAAWRHDQRQHIAALGHHEGGFVGPPGLPLTHVPITFAAAGALVAAVVAAVIGLSEVADLLDAGRGLLEPDERSPLLVGAALMTALIVLVLAIAALAAGAALRVLWLGRRWRHWRVDRDGLSRRLPDGSWRRLTVGPGDWIDPARARLGGEMVPLAMLSGGRLTRALVAGLADRRGVATRAAPTSAWTALRVALLWVPLVTVAWWTLLVAAGQLPGRQELWGAAMCELLAVLVAVAVWVEDRGVRRAAPRLAEEGREELAALGW